MLETELLWYLNSVLMLNWIIWKKNGFYIYFCIAQSAGSVEYRGVCPRNECPVYDIKQSDVEVPGTMKF